MKNNIISPEQFARYEAIIAEYDRFRTLSPEEREDIILRYGASMIHTQLRKGDSYGKLMPVYVVCFMNFRLQHDTDKLIYTYQLREVTGDGYTKPSILNLYLCELPRFAGDPGKASNPVEVWFDILQNMSNFASKPEKYGSRYDPIFEACRQSPIPDKDKLIRSGIALLSPDRYTLPGPFDYSAKRW